MLCSNFIVAASLLSNRSFHHLPNRIWVRFVTPRHLIAARCDLFCRGNRVHEQAESRQGQVDLPKASVVQAAAGVPGRGRYVLWAIAGRCHLSTTPHQACPCRHAGRRAGLHGLCGRRRPVPGQRRGPMQTGAKHLMSVLWARLWHGATLAEGEVSLNDCCLLQCK